MEFDIRRGARASIAATDLLLKSHNVRADLDVDSNLKNTYKFGISGGYQNNLSNPGTGVKRIIPDYNKYNVSAYGITNFKLDNTILTAGLRYDLDHINAKKFYNTSRWNALNYQQEFGQLIIDDLGNTTVSKSKVYIS